MHVPDDRFPPRGQTLDFPEAIRLLDPFEPEFKGEVDDKYEYSMESKDINVHGWISKKESVGFLQITPSNEFRSAGPLKQFLSSHIGPTNVAIFHSTHYAGADLIMRFNEGEAWKKVCKYFVYLNSFPQGIDPLLIALATSQDPGSKIEIGVLVYEPTRDGPTLWEIGLPDRSAAEFYIPDPNPMYVNKLYLNKINHKYQQYGLWERYLELYPKGDMISTILMMMFILIKDWFYMQVPRKVARRRYKGSTWQIRFKIGDIVKEKN